MGLLRTIAIILAVYFGFRLLTRWLAPIFLGYAARKVGERVKDIYGMNGEENGKRGPFNDQAAFGNEKIKNKKDQDKVGEYIEFEEID